MGLAFRLVAVEECVVHAIAATIALDEDADKRREHVAEAMTIAANLGLCVCGPCGDKLVRARATLDVVNAVLQPRPPPPPGSVS